MNLKIYLSNKLHVYISLYFIKKKRKEVNKLLLIKILMDKVINSLWILKLFQSINFKFDIRNIVK